MVNILVPLLSSSRQSSVSLSTAGWQLNQVLKNKRWSEKEMHVLENETTKYKPPNLFNWKAISKLISNSELKYRSKKAVSVLYVFFCKFGDAGLYDVSGYFPSIFPYI